MLALSFVLASLVLGVTVEERAQADKLVLQGAELGQQGQFRQAILYFKSAEELAPRASHDCNIGLAYARWERYPEALYYLQRCKIRTKKELPTWVDERIANTRRVLAEGKFAEVDIAIGPMSLAEISFDVLAPDEVFVAPIKIWLPLGEVIVTLRSIGFRPLERKIVLESTKPQPFHFVLETEKLAVQGVNLVEPTKHIDASQDKNVVVQTPVVDVKPAVAPEVRKPETLSDKLLREQKLEQQLTFKNQDRVWLERSLLALGILSAGVCVWQGISAHNQRNDAQGAEAGQATHAAETSKESAMRSDIAMATALTSFGFYWILTF